MAVTTVMYIWDRQRPRQEKVPLIYHCITGNLENVKISVDIVGVYVNEADNTGRTALHAASFCGYVDIVRFLLQRGAKVNARNDEGRTPLIEACKGDNYASACVEIVKLLINHNADVNAHGYNGATPLIEACIRSHAELVDILLQHKASVTDVDKSGHTPLDWTISRGHHAIIRGLLAHSDTDVNMHSAKGKTPLHQAVECDDNSIVQLLLITASKKIQVNAVDDNGDTPLHLAIREGFEDAIKTLLDSKADCNKVNKAGDAPLHIACQDCFDPIVREVAAGTANINLKNAQGLTPLHQATLARSKGSVRAIIRHENVDINAMDAEGRTAVFIACDRSFEEIVMDLIAHGACVNIPDKTGDMPLQRAVSTNRDIVVRVLLEHKATTLDFKDRYGRTALFTACHKGLTELAETLIYHGADVNSTDKKSRSPLALACKRNMISVVELILLRPECQIDIPSVYGCTPLHVACVYKRKEVVRLLVQYGSHVDFINPKNNVTALHLAIKTECVDTAMLLLPKMRYLNVTDFLGFTPLSRACEVNKPEVVRVLLKYNVDPNTTNRDGRSPLHLAVEQEAEAIVQLLLEARARVNVSDIRGVTPLHIACEKSNRNIASALVEAKADPHSPNRKGDTPLDIAERNKDEAMLKMFKHFMKYGSYLKKESSQRRL